MKRPRSRKGNVYEIDLGDGTHVYAREGTFGSVAIYDSRAKLALSIDEIVRLPILFYVLPMEFAIKECVWKILGYRSLADAPLPEVPPKGIKDINEKGKYRIYFNSGQMRSATRKEIEDLEPAMSWHPERIQKRILDYYNGFPDRWKESLSEYYPLD
jgi:hypothetical protein